MASAGVRVVARVIVELVPHALGHARVLPLQNGQLLLRQLVMLMRVVERFQPPFLCYRAAATTTARASALHHA